MTTSVNTKPHILLAYIWVMYMALFSGGRYIRATLQDAGVEFWSRSQSSAHSCPEVPRNNSYFPASPSSCERIASENQTPVRRRSSISGNQSPKVNQGLQFFHFLGDEDGEDIKKELKRRFAESDALLLPKEKDDIVQEAQNIFKFMLKMVGELDQVYGSIDQTSFQDVAMTGRRGLQTEGETVSRRRNLGSGKRTLPGFIQRIRECEVTHVAWRVNKLIDVLPVVQFQTLRSRLSRSGSLRTKERNVRAVGMDSTFVLSIILFASATIVWCFI